MRSTRSTVGGLLEVEQADRYPGKVDSSATVVTGLEAKSFTREAGTHVPLGGAERDHAIGIGDTALEVADVGRISRGACGREGEELRKVVGADAERVLSEGRTGVEGCGCRIRRSCEEALMHGRGVAILAVALWGACFAKPVLLRLM